MGDGVRRQRVTLKDCGCSSDKKFQLTRQILCLDSKRERETVVCVCVCLYCARIIFWCLERCFRYFLLGGEGGGKSRNSNEAAEEGTTNKTARSLFHVHSGLMRHHQRK
jgi:hypothetical protein